VPLEAYAEAIGEPVEKLYELPPPLSASAKLTDGLVDEVQAAVTAAVAKVLKRYR
jgi:hypothetical protein